METAGLIGLVSVLGGLAAIGATGKDIVRDAAKLVEDAKQGAQTLPPLGRLPLFGTQKPTEVPTPTPTIPETVPTPTPTIAEIPETVPTPTPPPPTVPTPPPPTVPTPPTVGDEFRVTDEGRSFTVRVTEVTPEFINTTVIEGDKPSGETVVYRPEEWKQTTKFLLPKVVPEPEVTCLPEGQEPPQEEMVAALEDTMPAFGPEPSPTTTTAPPTATTTSPTATTAPPTSASPKPGLTLRTPPAATTPPPAFPPPPSTPPPATALKPSMWVPSIFRKPTAATSSAAALLNEPALPATTPSMPAPPRPTAATSSAAALSGLAPTPISPDCQPPANVPVELPSNTTLVDVNDDGWCFYRAVLKGLEENPTNDPPNADYRPAQAFATEIRDWLRQPENKVKFETGFTETYSRTPVINVAGVSTALTYDQYLEYVPQLIEGTTFPQVWAELENTGIPEAAANLKDVTIAVYLKLDGVDKYQLVLSKNCATAPEEDSAKVIHLYNFNGNHFDLLLPSSSTSLPPSPAASEPQEVSTGPPSPLQLPATSIREVKRPVLPEKTQRIIAKLEEPSKKVEPPVLSEKTKRLLREIEKPPSVEPKSPRLRAAEKRRRSLSLSNQEETLRQIAQSPKTSEPSEAIRVDEEGNVSKTNPMFPQPVGPILAIRQPFPEDIEQAKAFLEHGIVPPPFKDIHDETEYLNVMKTYPEGELKQQIRTNWQIANYKPRSQVSRLPTWSRTVKANKGGMRKNTFRRRRGVITKRKDVRRTSYRKNRPNRSHSDTRRRT